MTTTVTEVFEEGTNAFNDHDLDRFAGVLAEDVTFQAPGAIRGEGRSACTEFFAGWITAFSDARVEVHAAHTIDDVVVEVGTFTGTHDGVLHTPAGDIPPTGRTVSVPYTHVLHFENGKHRSFNLMFDRLLMLEQLGLAGPGAPQ